MKNIFLNLSTIAGAILLAVSIPARVQSAEAVASKAAPRIQFSELVHDFGKVKTSDALRYDFIVTNTGNAVLEILEVKPGCGCTTAGTWDKQIQPGQTGKIPIQLNPANFSGAVTKSVSVTCNDPVKNIHSLLLKADIWKPIDIQPNYVQFLPVEDEATNETKVVRITNRTEEMITLEPPQVSNPVFKSELKTIQPGKEFELHVTYTGPATNGVPPGYITIKSSSTNLPTINVTAHAMPQPAVAISPAQITLPARQWDTAYKQSAFVRNNSKAPLKITEASVNADGVTVQIAESSPGRMFSLTIDYPANFHPPAGTSLQLTVKTSSPKRPSLSVPIIVAAKPATTTVLPPTAKVGSK